MKEQWSFLQNPFTAATNGSYLNAFRISTYHDAALNAAKADAFLLGLYNTYHPLHAAYEKAYNAWKQQGGAQVAETLTIKQLLNQLSSEKIKQWDVAIQNVYANTTPAYAKLLPGKRGPFQTGTQTSRISAVKTLSDAIGSDTALATLKTGIDDFYDQLKSKLASQKGAISKTGNNSSGLEAARLAICTAAYANLGALMQHFATNTPAIEVFFDLKNIRRGTQQVYTGAVKPAATLFVARRKFAVTDALQLNNTGTTTLTFYLAAKTKQLPAAGTGVTLAPGITQNITANNLGAVANNILLVYNADSSVNGMFEIDIVK